MDRPPRAHHPEVPLGARELVAHARAQYQRAMRDAAIQQRAIEESRAVISTDLLDLEVNPDGTLHDIRLSESARTVPPGQLSAACMQAHRAGHRTARDALVRELRRSHPAIAAQVEQSGPPVGRQAPAPDRPAQPGDRPAQPGQDEYPPPTKDGAAARWAQLRRSTPDPIARINALTRDPQVQQHLPQGDPGQWNHQARDRITRIVERGRANMARIRQLTAGAESDLVSVTVNIAGAPTSVSFRRQLADHDLDEVARDLLAQLGQAHRDVTRQAQALIEGI